MLPSSVELKVYEGVVSLSGVVTAVTSASIGDVVSVVEVLSVSELELVKESSFLAHEMIV